MCNPTDYDAPASVDDGHKHVARLGEQQVEEHTQHQGGYYRPEDDFLCLCCHNTLILNVKRYCLFTPPSLSAHDSV